MKYSIVVLSDGSVYVKASRNVITGNTKSEQRRNISGFFNSLLEGQPALDIHTIEGDVLTISKAQTAKKARDDYKSVGGKPVKMTDTEFALKMRVEAHIDEIAEVSKSGNQRRDTKNHSFAKSGFAYRRAYFEDFDGQYYEITLSIGNNGTQATVYNVGKMNKSVPPSAKIIAVVGSKALGGTLYGNSIRNPGENVKPKMSTRDSDGRQLTEAQQEYFKDSKVRDKDGNLLVMYHGTPNGGYTRFRSGTLFTPSAEYATVYQSPGASSLSVKPGASNPMNYEVYLNITKPFDTRNPKEREIFTKEYYRKYGTGAPLSESGLPDWTDGMDLQEFIEDMGYDYDGLILDEGATGGYGEAVKSRGLSYVTFSSEQAKRVDNLSPTSDPDMRYSGRDTDMSGGTAQKNTADEGGVRYQSKVESYQEPITQFDVDILRLAGKKVLIIFPPKRCKMHKSGRISSSFPLRISHRFSVLGSESGAKTVMPYSPVLSQKQTRR